MVIPHNEKRIALVTLTPTIDANELGAMNLPSYGIKRIQASLVADPELNQATVQIFDFERPDAQAYVDALNDFEPDLIGFSIYVWSTPCLIEVARQIKLSLPRCLIVFGGPSARTVVFDLPPYPPPHEVLDAVVASEGEVIFNKIAHLPEFTRSALQAITGLSIPDENGWTSTGPHTPIARLDDIASPYQLDLMPYHSVAYLETFRGCPMSCRFCEWGDSDNSTTTFSTEYIIREFQAYEEHDASAVFLVDAGLNLNKKAFNNLSQAEAETDYLKRSGGLWAEIYPSRISDEHLEFLSQVGVGYLGIGLQSLDARVLKDLERPFKQDRFEYSIRQIADVFHAEIQIIMGLPGDTPEGFKRTLEFARAMPVGVRAYHCLVLPDALLTRGKPEWKIQFDPITLEMISCLGWTQSDIQEMREYMTHYSIRSGGTSGDYWWFFPPNH
jgi:radical SAM superfamily enzyme YgiQ (UPF0313 family)